MNLQIIGPKFTKTEAFQKAFSISQIAVDKQ